MRKGAGWAVNRSVGGLKGNKMKVVGAKLGWKLYCASSLFLRSMFWVLEYLVGAVEMMSKDMAEL